MTSARLVSNPSEGHGLVPRLTDPLFHALANDETVESIPCVVLLKPVGHGSRNTANGRKQFVQFEVARIEPVTDSHDAEQVRHMIQTAWESRHGQTLPLDFPDQDPDTQRRFLLGLVDEWAAEHSYTPSDVAAQYREHFAIEGDEVSPDGSFPHPDPNKAAPHHLREWMLTTGILADDDVAGTEDDDEAVRSGIEKAAGPDAL